MNSRKQTKKPLKPDDFYSILSAEDPQLHPDEKIAVYVKVTPEFEGKKYTRKLCLLDLKTAKETDLTIGSQGGDFMPRWSPDGTKLAFLSARNEKTQIFVLEPGWGEARQITSVRNGVNMFVWSPDSKAVAFLSRTREEERREEGQHPGKKKQLSELERKRQKEDQDHAETMRIDPRVYYRTVFRQGTIFKDDRNTHVYIQKIDGDRPIRLTDGAFDYGPMCWSPDAGSIITSTGKLARDPDIDIRSDLVRIDVNSQSQEYLTSDDNGNFNPRFCPSGKWIYYLSFQNTNRHQQRIQLRRIPVAGGDAEELMPEYDYDPHMFHLDRKGEWIYFPVSCKGRDSIARVPSDGGNPEFVIRNNGMVGEFHAVDTQCVYSAEAPDMPADIFTAPLKRKPSGTYDDTVCHLPKKAERLTHINKKFLNRRSLSMPHEIWLDRPDGIRVQGWYMLPHNYKPGNQYPWVVQIHGGPHIMWGYSFWHEFQSMCGRGYGVYFSNPRGSDGYGSAFKGAIHKKWGEEDSQDILAGIETMVEMGLADPDRLFVTGGSFGGFMTGWIATHDHRFKAAVAQRGVYNFVSMYGASDALTLIEWEFDTLPWKNTELLWDRSPLKYVESTTTPVMIIHSEQDFRVGISQAEEFYTALKREGKKACLVRYPREGHELSRSGEPRHRVDRINRIIGWFDEHLPGE